MLEVCIHYTYFFKRTQAAQRFNADFAPKGIKTWWRGGLAAGSTGPILSVR